MKFLPAATNVERRSDGTLILRSPVPEASYGRCIGEHLEYWASHTPEHPFLMQREGEGWRSLNYAEARRRVRAVASRFLELGLTRPVAILSDNSIEHAIMSLAAMHAGIPAAPISPAYSLMCRDFGKLRSIFELIRPALVFANDGARFAKAIDAVADHDFETVVLQNGDALNRQFTPFGSLLEKETANIVDRAFAAVTPDTMAKLLMTSGSTGQPKAVINTQRMLCTNQRSIAQCWPLLTDEKPVLVDWLPWNHTFGGNFTFNTVLALGGTMYIDEGKPAPGLIETTVRNLREVSPTSYFNVPRGYDMLLPYLTDDAELRRTFFARVQTVMYAAAALPANLFAQLSRLAVRETGAAVKLVSGWGATETAPCVTLVHFDTTRPTVIGLPLPGVELKMIPLSVDGKYEFRVRGSNVTPGYLNRPDLTHAAFDDEGFYRIGDAGRFANPDEPLQGLEFAGRLAEDFKLLSGTWVHVGALRIQAIEALTPFAQDVVVAGHDRDEIGLLIFPGAAAREKSAAEVHGQIRAGLHRLREKSCGSSTFASRALLLLDPPSIDAGEITDKGYINQAAVLERRSELVQRLYADPLPADVITL